MTTAPSTHTINGAPAGTHAHGTRVLMIDNYDSFTYNIVQHLATLGAHVDTYRNDEISVDAAVSLAPDRVVISPGPGGPDTAGCSMDIVRAFAGRVPVLGVCLGHQAIAAVYGAPTKRMPRLMHGMATTITHDSKGVYEGVPAQLEVGRYHSLGVFEEDLPDELIPTAWTEQGELMGIRHRELPIEGVQFHPESVLTPEGATMLSNFLSFDAASDTQLLQREETP